MATKDKHYNGSKETYVYITAHSVYILQRIIAHYSPQNHNQIEYGNQRRFFVVLQHDWTFISSFIIQEEDSIVLIC